jgi:adenosine deaminase
MRAAGILATLNTDDPALINIDLGYEYRAVSSAMGWGFNEMVGLAHDGVDGSWLDDSDKLSLHHHIDERVSELRDQLNESSSA